MVESTHLYPQPFLMGGCQHRAQYAILLRTNAFPIVHELQNKRVQHLWLGTGSIR